MHTFGGRFYHLNPEKPRTSRVVCTGRYTTYLYNKSKSQTYSGVWMLAPQSHLNDLTDLHKT